MNTELKLTGMIDLFNGNKMFPHDGSMFYYFCSDPVEALSFEIDRDLLYKMFREFCPECVHVQKSLNQRIFYRII